MRSITIYYYTNSPASKHILVALREADKETRLLILESVGRAFGGLKLFKGLRDGQESYAVLSISTCKAVTDFLLIALTLGLLESFALKSHLSTNPICRVLGAGRIEIVAARVPENPKTLQPILCRCKQLYGPLPIVGWGSKSVDHCLAHSHKIFISIYVAGRPTRVWPLIEAQQANLHPSPEEPHEPHRLFELTSSAQAY
jgi:hypothetical protein